MKFGRLYRDISKRFSTWQHFSIKFSFQTDKLPSLCPPPPRTFSFLNLFYFKFRWKIFFLPSFLSPRPSFDWVIYPRWIGCRVVKAWVYAEAQKLWLIIIRLLSNLHFYSETFPRRKTWKFLDQKTLFNFFVSSVKWKQKLSQNDERDSHWRILNTQRFNKSSLVWWQTVEFHF